MMTLQAAKVMITLTEPLQQQRFSFTSHGVNLVGTAQELLRRRSQHREVRGVRGVRSVAHCAVKYDHKTAIERLEESPSTPFTWTYHRAERGAANLQKTHILSQRFARTAAKQNRWFCSNFVVFYCYITDRVVSRRLRQQGDAAAAEQRDSC